MEAKPIKIQLLPAPDDGPLENPEYQKAIRDFAESLHARGLKPSTVIRSMDAAAGDAPAIYSGAFQLAKDALPVIFVLIGAWLKSRNGRKVRLKVGEVEAEAQTVEQLKKVLKLAEKHKKKAHES